MTRSNNLAMSPRARLARGHTGDGDSSGVADSTRTWSQWGLVIGVCVALWSMHDDVKKAQSQADEAESQVAALQAKVEELSDDVDECESKAKEIDSNVDDLDSKVDAIDSRVDDLESR